MVAPCFHLSSVTCDNCANRTTPRYDLTGHRTVGFLKTYDESRLRNLRIQLQDYLFDKGHTINKSMIDDLSIFVYDLNESHYNQGRTTLTTYPPREDGDATGSST